MTSYFKKSMSAPEKKMHKTKNKQLEISQNLTEINRVFAK